MAGHVSLYCRTRTARLDYVQVSHGDDAMLYYLRRFMTTARLTKRRTSLEKHKAEVIAFLLTGWIPARIAEKYSVSREAVSKFIQRHADELTALQTVVDKQVTDYAIAHKVNRIVAKDQRWQLLEQVRQARAKGDQGMETGLVVRTYKALGSGDNMTIVEEFKIDDGLLSAMDRLEHMTAEELAQLPRPDVHVQQNLTLIREVHMHGRDDTNLG